MAKWENVRVKAVYDYAARTANELSFKKGQSIFVFSADDDGWASGECMGRQGASFCTNWVISSNAARRCV